MPRPAVAPTGSIPRRHAAGLRVALLGVLGLACAHGTPVWVGAAPGELDPDLPELRLVSVGSRLVPPDPSRARGAHALVEQDAKLSIQIELEEAHVSGTLQLDATPFLDDAGHFSRLRVKLSDDERLFGVRRLQLVDSHLPGTAELLEIQRQMRAEGVLVPRSWLVNLIVDRRPIGVALVQEAFSKQLVEAQRRREGILFKLDASALPVARVVAYSPKRIEDRDTLERQLHTVQGLLASFLEGQSPAREVFDLALMSRFIAVAESAGGSALLRAPDLRFYFNPVTQRIEPIAFASCPCDNPSETLQHTGWIGQLLADPELHEATTRERERLGARRLALPGRTRRPARKRTPAVAAEGRPIGYDGLRADPRVERIEHNPIPTSDLDQALSSHPFLRHDAAEKRLRADPGRHRIRGSLILPEGLGLRLEAGTTLLFEPGAMLLATGPLDFDGSPDAPVVLEGTEGGSWAGIVALRSELPHAWRHVRVRGTAGIDLDGWVLTGGVTLREADVTIERSQILGNRAEDALNLIRARFLLVDTRIEDARSDAFDCDFCEGRVDRGVFREIGGDGIDVSGSEITVSGSELEEIHDKAISVGEASRLVARGLAIRDVGTAVASKDGSSVVFEDSRVTDVEYVAIMAYTKKHEYGPAQVNARGIDMERVARPTLAQSGSRVVLDGVDQPPEAIDVDQLYQDGYMKK